MAKRKKKTKAQKKKRRILKISIGGLLLVLIVGLGLFASVYLGVWGHIPTEKELTNLSQSQASQVYDDRRQLIGKYFITDREPVEFQDFPEDLIHALVATEDARFYEHNGIDNKSLFRVFFKTILRGNRSSGGGSTLTLQLAKNLYGRQHYAFFSIGINKLREAIIARRIEKQYSKDEILTLYLNTVPFSGSTYGIESAALKFFNTHTKNLSLAQAATLVGTLKANHSYNPRLFPEKSQLRRDVVLTQMLKYDYISEERAIQEMQNKLTINYKTYGSSNGPAPYFMEQVRKEVEHLLQNKQYFKKDGTPYLLKEDGLKIYTTLDRRLQNYAEQAVQERMQQLQDNFEKAYGLNPPWRANSFVVDKALKKLPAYKSLQKKGLSDKEIKDSLGRVKEMEVFNWRENEVQALSTIDSLRHYMKFLNTGMLSVDPHTGAVKAYIGGIDYRYFQYDHVRQSKRQVGSIFKPIVYAAALEHGLSACDYFSAKPVTYTDQDDWTPRDAGKVDTDIEYSLSEALTRSLNTVTVKILRETGVANVVNQAHKMGIAEKIEHRPSIALGVSDLKVWDMAKAYTTFLNDGKPINPYFIKRIEDKEGNLIAEFTPENTAPEAFAEETREQVLEILKQVINRGTGQRLRSVYGFKNDLAGKTGTTQDNTDGWFVGMLPDLVTVTWVGNDNSQIKFPSTAMGQGANSALPIFAKLLQKMNADPSFNSITQARFKPTSPEVLELMDCDTTEKEGFFKRLFGKKNPDKKFKKEQQKKQKEKRKKRRKKKKGKGFFNKIFGKKK